MSVSDEGYYVPDEGYYVPDGGYYVPDEGYYVPDEGYYVPDGGYYVPNEGYYVPDEGYSRNASCGLNLISSFFFFFHTVFAKNLSKIKYHCGRFFMIIQDRFMQHCLKRNTSSRGTFIIMVQFLVLDIESIHIVLIYMHSLKCGNYNRINSFKLY